MKTINSTPEKKTPEKRSNKFALVTLTIAGILQTISSCEKIETLKTENENLTHEKTILAKQISALVETLQENNSELLNVIDAKLDEIVDEEMK